MRTRVVNQARRAFTLIEILIVVVILGILAAIVIPQFTDAADSANESAIKSTLQTVRSQIELYRFKNGAYPADIATLVAGDYLQQEPLSPDATYYYDYDAATGEYLALVTADDSDTGW